jgi:hypothetical protein
LHLEAILCAVRQKNIILFKSDIMHEIVTRLFIIRYNLSLIT